MAATTIPNQIAPAMPTMPLAALPNPHFPKAAPLDNNNVDLASYIAAMQQTQGAPYANVMDPYNQQATQQNNLMQNAAAIPQPYANQDGMQLTPQLLGMINPNDPNMQLAAAQGKLNQQQPGYSMNPVYSSQLAGLQIPNVNPMPLLPPTNNAMQTLHGTASFGNLADPLAGGLRTDGAILSNSNVACVNFNAQELIFYQNIWNLVNPLQQPYIDGQSGAAFLEKSGLNRNTLHEVWRLADSQDQGILDKDGFFIACRLIAHIQSGLPICKELLNLYPQCLPTFDSSSTSGLSILENEAQGDDAKSKNEQTAMGARSGGTSDSVALSAIEQPWMDVDEVVWSLTEKERTRYDALFRLIDSNGDGLVEGTEAKSIMSKSGLRSKDLMQIWDLSDYDEDGRLNLNEFLIAMGLINRRKKGAEIPVRLPSEMEALLHDKSGRCGKTDGATDLMHAADRFKSERSKRINEFSKSDYLSPKGYSSQEYLGPTKSRPLLNTVHPTYSTSPAIALESAVETDKEIARTIARGVTDCASELRNLGDINEELKLEIVREKQELQHQIQRKRDFESQLDGQKAIYEDLKEERRQVELERISVSRDLDHLQHEIVFLRQQNEEMKRDISTILDTNQMLDTGIKQSESQVKTLYAARRRVMQSIDSERKSIKVKEREITEARNNLERMKRDKDNALSKQSVLQERLRQADQDRTMLVTALESERSKFMRLREQDLHLTEEKHNILQEMSSISQQALMNRPTMQNSIVDRPSNSVPNNNGVCRDAKGIPSAPLALADNRSPSDLGVSYGAMPNSKPNQWKLFGQDRGLTHEVKVSKATELNHERQLERPSLDLESPTELSGKGFGGTYIGYQKTESA